MKTTNKKRTFSTGHTATEYPRGHDLGVPSIVGHAPHPTTDDTEDGNLFKVSLPSSRKKRKLADKNGVNQKQTGRSVLALTSKRLIPGMLVLGVIKDINEIDLAVSLPNQRIGFVSITDISEQLTKQVEEYANEEDEDQSSALMPNLSSLFRVGQLVRCVVLSIGDTSTGSSKKSRIELSLKPAQVNSTIASNEIYPGMTMQAAISSHEDHGYVVDMGLEGMTGFLAEKDVAKFIATVNDSQPLVPGQLIKCSVVNLPESSSRAINLSLDPKVLKRPFARDASKITLSQILPGMLVTCTITSIQLHGISVSLLGDLAGTIHYLHLQDAHAGDLSTYKVGTQITARILWKDTDSSTLVLGNSNHLLSADSSLIFPSSLDIGATIDATITHVDTHVGVVAQVEHDGQSFCAFIPLSKLSDQDITSVPSSFKTGTTHTARVININLLDGVLVLSCQASVLAREFWSLKTLTIGQELTGSIVKLAPFGAIVNVSESLNGVCPSLHLSDIVLLHPEKKYQAGKSFKFRVLSLDIKARRLQLTSKKTLLNTTLPLLTSYQDAAPGLITHGVVLSVQEHGLVVTFWNNIVGFVPKSETMTAMSLTNGNELDLRILFKRGQSVKCRVISSNPTAEKLRLSLNQLDTHSHYDSAKQLDNHGKGYEPLSVGAVVSAQLKFKEDNQMMFMNENGIRIVVPWQHLSDSLTLAEKLSRSLETNSAHEVLVLHLKEKTGQYMGSLKPALIAAANASQLPQTLQDIKKGSLVPGFISGVHEFGAFITFAGNLCGRASTKRIHISDTLTKSGDNPLEVGQTVLTLITDVDKDKQRIVLSLKESDVMHAARPEYLQSLAITRAMLVQRQLLRMPSWADKVKIGLVVSCTVVRLSGGVVHVQCDFEGTLVPGRIQAHQVDNTDAEKSKLKKNDTTKALLLDLDPESKCVDLSVKYAQLKLKNPQKIQPTTKYEAIVELCKDDYAIVFVPTLRCFAFVLRAHVNTRHPLPFKSLERIVVTLPEPKRIPLIGIMDMTDATSQTHRVAKGEVIEAKIIRVSPKLLNLTLPNGKQGIVSTLELCVDGQPPQMQLYRVGTTIKVRVLKVKPKHIECSVRAVTSRPIDIKDLEEGSAVVAQVTKLQSLVMYVQLTDNIHGRVFVTDLSDQFQTEPFKSISLGDIIHCTVLKKNVDLASLDLSMRPSRRNYIEERLVVSDKEITTVQDVEILGVYRGYVKHVADNSGVFVSLGREIEGRIKISDLSDDYILAWKDLVPIGKLITVKVLSVHPDTGAINLSMKKSDITPQTSKLQYSDMKKGDKMTGTVRKVEKFGLFINIDDSATTGLCHISQIADQRVDNLEKLYKTGDAVKVIILEVNALNKRVSLGMKPSYFADEVGEDNSAEVEINAESDKDEDESHDGPEDMDTNEDDAEEIINSDVSEEENTMEVDLEDSEEEDSSDELTNEQSIKPLKVAAFDWSVNFSDNDENNRSDDNDEDESNDNITNNQHKLDTTQSASKRQKKRVKADKEAEIARRENELLDPLRQPQLPEDFERMLIGSPNSSYLWIKYIAFQLKSAHLAKAREVAERAIKTIHYREEQEKLNVWVAWMNLENEFGTQESLEQLFQRAKQYNDPKTMYMHLVNIYARSKKEELAEELYRVILKKFKTSSKMWVSFGLFLIEYNRLEEARSVLQRSLKFLEKRKHIKTIVKFAQMEFKYGEPERGRTILESVMSNYPKRIDLWSVYLDLEIKLQDKEAIRHLFDRIITFNMSSKKMKFFFKKYLEYEKKFGDEERVAYVKQKAMEYVESLDA